MENKRFEGVNEMKHLGTCRLETERLYLRKFKVSDATMVYENWSSDREVTRYVAWPVHQNVNTTKRILANWESAYQRLDIYQWAIVYRENEQVIGSISLYQFIRRGRRYRCELGYCLSKDYWNQGLMTEAATAVLQFAFEQIGVDTVIAKHDVRNPASGRVMKKIGMHHDRLVTRAVLNGHREWVDCDTYIIYKDEFMTA